MSIIRSSRRHCNDEIARVFLHINLARPFGIWRSSSTRVQLSSTLAHYLQPYDLYVIMVGIRKKLEPMSWLHWIHEFYLRWVSASLLACQWYPRVPSEPVSKVPGPSIGILLVPYVVEEKTEKRKHTVADVKRRLTAVLPPTYGITYVLVLWTLVDTR